MPGAARAAVERSAAPPAVGGHVGRPVRVLVVEDHADSAEMLTHVLRAQGYQVQVAGLVTAAKELARACDLLISDIRLPDGSGLDLMQDIRSRGPVRGIALSGFGTEDDERRSREAGYRAHLTKPIDVTRLLEVIERVLEEPQ